MTHKIVTSAILRRIFKILAFTTVSSYTYLSETMLFFFFVGLPEADVSKRLCGRTALSVSVSEGCVFSELVFR